MRLQLRGEHPLLYLVLVMAGGATSLSGQFTPSFAQPDSVPEAIEAVQIVLADRYQGWMRLPAQIRGPLCDADAGENCYYGDIDGACRHIRCRRVEEDIAFAEELAQIAARWPESAIALSQAVYAAVKFDLRGTVARLIEGCEATGSRWWCHAASGYSAHRFRDLGRAQREFEQALDLMPDPVRCWFLDVSSLLVSGAEAYRLEVGSCIEMIPPEEIFWWLSDPFLAADGVNDRWTEHMARVFEGVANEDLVQRRGIAFHRYGFRPRGFANLWLRRGFPDSWARTPLYAPDHPTAIWTSRRAAFNHFVPEVFALDSLHPGLEYRLEARLTRSVDSDEGYTRAGGRVFEIPAQHARFLEGDSMVVALASRLVDSGIGGTGQAFFMASTGPGDVVTLDPSPLRETVVFAGQVANRRQLVGIEVLTLGDDARSREVIDPLDPEGPLISDLLLYRPVGFELPGTRLGAAGMMHGSVEIRQDRDLGLYWEGYGLPADTELRASLRLGKVEGGGLFSGLGRALGLGGADETGAVSWTVTTPETGIFTHAITLDLASVDRSEYELVLTMELPDGTLLTRSRRFEVVEGEGR